jgi:hypothetical protein
LLHSKIRLTYDAIPVTFVTARQLASIPSKHVVNSKLNHLIDEPVKGTEVINCAEPLLRLKITYDTEETHTYLGISWHHTLGKSVTTLFYTSVQPIIGDASALLHFMSTLSYLYQQPDGDEHITRPTFVKHAFEEPSDEKIATILPLMPHLSTTYSSAALKTYYALHSVPTAAVMLRLTNSHIEHLRIKATNIKDISDKQRLDVLSSQDLVTAWVVALFDRCTDVHIRRLTNVVSVSKFS